MGFDEGQVIFDSPNLSYFTGQTVHGRLEFDQDKVKTFRGIYVKMKGFCKLHWTSSHSRRVNDRTEHYTVNHDSYECYYENKVYLVGGTSGDHSIGVGHHVFPFECYIPPHCPSSFESSNGHIRYTFKFVVDRAFKIDQEKKMTINVVAPKDLNVEPYCREPLEFQFNESYCCWCMSSGDCEILVKLPASGYCSKQTIPIELSVANNSNVEISLITFKIKEIITYHANFEPDTRNGVDTIAKLKKGPVPGNTTRNWALEMEVPEMDIHNVDACKFIDIDYEFAVEIETESCHSDTGTSSRIVLGHIPLRGLGEVPPQDQITNQPVAPMQQFPAPQPYPNPSFPGPNQPYNGGNPPFPGPNSQYPGANPSFPGANPPFPGANQPYPGANPPFPGANPPFLGPNSQYPGANPPYPGANPHPGANPPYPGANPSVPGANAQYPGANPPYPGANPPYPGANPPYPGNHTIGFSAPISGEKQNSAAPMLPPTAAVPYPPNPPANPYATASAPEPGTPDFEAAKPLMDENVNSPYNPEFTKDEKK